MYEKKAHEKLQEVRLEDPIFRNYFNVYSSDQVEARYLLPPDFMEYIKKLERISGGGLISCFTGQELTIMIPLKGDYFEAPSPKETLLNDSLYHSYLFEIYEILRIIDILKIGKRL